MMQIPLRQGSLAMIVVSVIAAPTLNNSVYAAEPRAITLPGDRFFPEGVTVTRDGTFFVGSMEEGAIARVRPGSTVAEPFIASGSNGLVSVLGVLADDARGLLRACSSDAGNAPLSGTSPVAVKAFDLASGEARGSYDLPGGGFCNDLTLDDQGNVYVTDSWSPRILRLPAGGSTLEAWASDEQLGSEQWSLNGIDFDPATRSIYTVNQRAGKLFRIALGSDGQAGAITQISTSRELRRPDGLKVLGPQTLATAEGGSGGMALLTLDGDRAEVRTVSEGLNGVATFAFWQGSAWIVENQGQHFWDPDNAGRDAAPPFRLVEVPLGLEAAPAAAPATPPSTQPARLPNTGAATGLPLPLLALAVLATLGGLVLRLRARRAASH
jgi:LPXTG-motif cell wall-anchored protein